MYCLGIQWRSGPSSFCVSWYYLNMFEIIAVSETSQSPPFSCMTLLTLFLSLFPGMPSREANWIASQIDERLAWFVYTLHQDISSCLGCEKVSCSRGKQIRTLLLILYQVLLARSLSLSWILIGLAKYFFPFRRFRAGLVLEEGAYADREDASLPRGVPIHKM